MLFVYHFGTRAAFVEVLIEECYAPLQCAVSCRAAGVAQPLAGLRTAIFSVVDFSLAHDGLMGRILMAAADNDEPAKAGTSLPARMPTRASTAPANPRTGAIHIQG